MRRWGCSRESGGERRGDTLDLPNVIDIVAGHGFDDGPEGHGAALGVGGDAVAVGFCDGAEEAEIPFAGILEEIERLRKIVCGIALCPGLLVEGLDDRVGLVWRGAERLAKTKRKDEFAVGQVGDDLTDAPFVRSWSVVDLLDGEGSEDAAKTQCGSEEDWDRVLPVEESGVRIEFHSEKVSRVVGGESRCLSAGCV
jgi:hypothetical protein